MCIRDSLLVADERVFREQFAIDVRTRCEAIAISPEKKTVDLRNVATGEGARALIAPDPFFEHVNQQALLVAAGHAQGGCDARANRRASTDPGLGSLLASGVSSVGIEPTTHGLKVRCSTD